MKNTLIKYFLLFLIISASVLILIFSISGIEIDSSIYSLLPSDYNLKRTVKLTSHSSVSDKVLLYISADSREIMDSAIDEVNSFISEYKFLEDYLPDGDDIADIRSYLQDNSLVLYPYELMEAPFSRESIRERLDAKFDYLLSSPFEDLSESFFSDPLNLSLDILKMQFKASNLFSMYKGGVVSEDYTAYLRVFSSGFYPEEYGKSAELEKIDKKLKEINPSYSAFIFSSHLYFLESSQTIQKEIFVIFFVSILLTLFIFIYFFRRLSLLIYSIMPILAGISITFLAVRIFYGRFGAIAIAFGATSAGICIDYSIHYISKLNLYTTLTELRKKIGLSMFMGYVTTLISFMILPFSGINSLIEIAVFGVAVLTLSFIFSWFVLQAFIKPENVNYEIKVINFTGLYKSRFHRLAFSVMALLIIISVVFSVFLKLESNPFGLDMAHNELDKKASLIMENFGESTDNVFIAFYGNTPDHAIESSIKATVLLYNENEDLLFLNPAIFLASDSIIKRRIEYIKTAFNYNYFKEAISKSEFTEDSFYPFEEKYNSAVSGEYNITHKPSYLADELKKSIVEYDDKFYYMIHIGSREKAAGIEDVLKKGGIDYIAVDILKDSAYGLLEFEKRALFLVVFSLLIISFLLFFINKKFIYAFTSVLPAVSGVSSAIAAAVLTNTPINIMHITAFILIVGIGVDYGIFVSNVISNNGNVAEINRTIQSILSSALTTVAGFGVLAFSSSRAVHSLGISMLIGIMTAFLTAYIILPYVIGNKKS